MKYQYLKGDYVSKETFVALVRELGESIGDRDLDAKLQDALNAKFPKNSSTIKQLYALCQEGERDGWMLGYEAGGVKYGRVIKPNTQAGRFSVDVVRMKNVVGPHHIHPKGEIGIILPIEGEPLFDDYDTTWYVFAPQTNHFPTVTKGDAYIIYFLPEGAIEFTGKPVPNQ